MWSQNGKEWAWLSIPQILYWGLATCQAPCWMLRSQRWPRRGGPCPHGSSILVGEMGVNLKTWYTMERLFPVWQAKAQMGNEELRLGADGPPLRTGGWETRQVSYTKRGRGGRLMLVQTRVCIKAFDMSEELEECLPLPTQPKFINVSRFLYIQ